MHSFCVESSVHEMLCNWFREKWKLIPYRWCQRLPLILQPLSLAGFSRKQRYVYGCLARAHSNDFRKSDTRITTLRTQAHNLPSHRAQRLPRSEWVYYYYALCKREASLLFFVNEKKGHKPLNQVFFWHAGSDSVSPEFPVRVTVLKAWNFYYLASHTWETWLGI